MDGSGLVHRGPLPVIADCSLDDLAQSPEELCEGAKTLGASAIGIRYYLRDWAEADELEAALKGAVAAAEETGLGALLLGEFGADGAEGDEGAAMLTSRVGAAAGLAKGGGADCAAQVDGAVTLGCWDGSDAALASLRDAGFSGLVLKDACDGDVARGARIKSPSLAAQSVTKLVKMALSKGSTSVWAGAGTTSGGGGEASMDSYFSSRGP